MRNLFYYLQSRPAPNFHDMCCDYIEDAHTQDGEMRANEKTYNFCVDYINGCISEAGKEYLKNEFKIVVFLK